MRNVFVVVLAISVFALGIPFVRAHAQVVNNQTAIVELQLAELLTQLRDLYLALLKVVSGTSAKSGTISVPTRLPSTQTQVQVVSPPAPTPVPTPTRATASPAPASVRQQPSAPAPTLGTVPQFQNFLKNGALGSRPVKMNGNFSCNNLNEPQRTVCRKLYPAL